MVKNSKIAKTGTAVAAPTPLLDWIVLPLDTSTYFEILFACNKH